MCDVGERPGVHQRRCAFQRLHQRRHDGVLHQDGHRAGDAQVLGGHRVAGIAAADDDTAQPLAHVLEAGGERQDRHHFAGYGDVVAGLARHTILLGSQADNDLAQRAVVDIHNPVPGDRIRVDVQRLEAGYFLETLAIVTLVHDTGVDRGGQQVVGGSHGMDVARQMQVEIFHRHGLAIAAAGSAALDAEGRSLRGLANAGKDALAQVCAQRLAEADRRGRFAFAQRRRRDCSHIDILALRAVLELFDNVEMDLGFVFTVEVEIVFGQTNLRGNFHDGSQRGGLRDIDIAGNGFEIGKLRHFAGLLLCSPNGDDRSLMLAGCEAGNRFTRKLCPIVPSFAAGTMTQVMIWAVRARICLQIKRRAKKDAVDGSRLRLQAGTTGCQSSNFSSLLARLAKLVTPTCRSTSLPSLK